MTPGGARVDPVHQSNILGVSRAPRVVVGWKSTRRTTTAVIFEKKSAVVFPLVLRWA